MIFARCFDFVDGSLDVAVTFHVEGDDVCACFHEIVDVAQRFADHQMYVEDTAEVFADHAVNACTEGDVWYKVAVHYVDVEHFHAGSVHISCFLAQICEISSQNGWGNFNHKNRFLFIRILLSENSGKVHSLSVYFNIYIAERSTVFGIITRKKPTSGEVGFSETIKV